MNRILLLLVSVGILAALVAGGWFFFSQKKAQDFRADLQRADSFEIAYFSSETGEPLYHTRVDYEPQVWLLTGTISDTEAPVDCGYLGTVQFFVSGTPVFDEPAIFQTAPNCRFLAFRYQEKIYRKVLLEEGSNYLDSLLLDLQK